VCVCEQSEVCVCVSRVKCVCVTVCAERSVCVCACSNYLPISGVQIHSYYVHFTHINESFTNEWIRGGHEVRNMMWEGEHAWDEGSLCCVSQMAP
jgi:hypothetical protein